LAVRRLGRHHQYELRRLRLHAGDVLLLQGQREALRGLQEEGEVLLIEGVERTLTFSRKAPLAIGILLAVVALAALDIAPIVLLAFAGVGMMLLTKCLTLPDATRALDSSVLLLLAGMIPLGLAMEKSGLARLISEAVVGFAGPLGPVFLIGSFYLLTSLLTEVLSNNAAAVLLTPICLGVAATTGMDPKPLLIAVTFGASASFATPIGYQTNTMVMGPGGYLFRDYLRVGVPMNLLLWIVATLLIPWIWPP
jgi:di/tricarboxylate transporter